MRTTSSETKLQKAILLLKSKGCYFELYRGVNTQMLHTKRATNKGLGFLRAIGILKHHGFKIVENYK